METSSASMVEFRHVSVQRGQRLALNDVSLKIAVGEHVAILGPNGSGKSTLIKAISQECYPLAKDETSVKIFGRDRWDVSELRNRMGIVANDTMALCSRPITGGEAVISGFFSSAGLWPHQQVTAEMRERAAEALELLEASHLENRRIREMSSGETRRILIARALVHQPQVLVFDEPSNSLDLFGQEELRLTMRKLAQAGITILLVTHHLADLIPEIERVILMRGGQIIADGTKDRLITQKSLSELFGVRVEVTRRDGYYHAW